jgi:hypothetical protein
VPAAAVIPAPIAYVKVVAVKKLVVGSRRVGGGSDLCRDCPTEVLLFDFLAEACRVLLIECLSLAPSGLL